jgi:hypothetical protein
MKHDELPDKLRRELDQYIANYTEWKKMCNVMNRLDKAVKEYMILKEVDFIEGEGFQLSMAHPIRFMLDQSLIENLEQYKVKKAINVLTVNIDEIEETEDMAAKRARNN